MCVCVRRYVFVPVLLLPGAFRRWRPSVVRGRRGAEIRRREPRPLDQEGHRPPHEPQPLKEPITCRHLTAVIYTNKKLFF